MRIWIERGGRAVLGQGRLELLEEIERSHSISAAARRLGMSYRRAWLLVQSMNAAAAEPMVQLATGGSGGGGARLTVSGRRAMTIFQAVSAELKRAAATTLLELLRPPEAPVVRVAAAISLAPVLGELFADYALAQPAVAVRALFGGSDALAELLLHGGAADLVLSADLAQLVRLEDAGMMEPGSRTAVAENRLAVLARPGWKRKLRRAADLARPEVTRLALADPACPLGAYARSYLRSQNLEATFGPRILSVDNSLAVVAALRARAADIGLVYGSDVPAARDCRLLFRLPDRVGAIRYWGAVPSRSRCPQQARQLLDFLTARSAAARFRGCGFLPVRRPRSVI